jgi:hypothetical protein
MSDPSPAAVTNHSDEDRLIYTADICTAVGVTDRCIRKWVVRGCFPQPDANLRGRNCWKLSTFRTWKSDVLAGRYAKYRRPGHSQPANESPPVA